MGAPLLPTRQGDSPQRLQSLFQSLRRRPLVLGRPSRPKDRARPTKSEIIFGHAFDRQRYRHPEALCARASRPSSISIEERAVLEVSGGVGRHEGALRDHPFSIASQRFENAMCQPRSVPWPDSSCVASVWSRTRRLLVADCERAVAEGHFKPVHCRIVQDTAAASGASRVSGRTATDAWFFAHAAHRLHSVDNQIEDYLP